MDKLILTALLLFTSLTIKAENYIISYPGYLDGDPVILKASLSGSTAVVDGEQYVVTQNNEVGIVMVKSFAQESTAKQPYAGGLGVFCIILDKKTNKMMRGNILMGETKNSITTGSFVVDR